MIRSGGLDSIGPAIPGHSEFINVAWFREGTKDVLGLRAAPEQLLSLIGVSGLEVVLPLERTGSDIKM